MKCLFSIISLLLLASAAFAQETKSDRFPPKRTTDPIVTPRVAQPIPVRTSGDVKPSQSNAVIPLRKTDGARPATGKNPTANTVQSASGKTAAPYPSALSAKQALDLRKEKEAGKTNVPAVAPKQGQ